MNDSDRTTSDPTRLLESAWALRRSAFAGPTDDLPGQLAQARSRLEEAVEHLRDAEDPVLLAHALHLVAHVETDLGRPARARELWQESVALLRTAHDPLQLAHKLRHLGDLLRTEGPVDEARSLLEEAVALHRDHSKDHDENPNVSLDLANALRRLALLNEEQEEIDTARTQWAEARDLYARLGISAGVDEAAQHLRALVGEDGTA